MTYIIKYVFQKNRRFKSSVFNIVAGINQSKTLTKHISCECKCKSDVENCN